MIIIYEYFQGGQLTVRSNWRIYCAEFQLATQAAIEADYLPPYINISSTGGVEFYNTEDPMSHFELKYNSVNVELFQIEMDLKDKLIA